MVEKNKQMKVFFKENLWEKATPEIHTRDSFIAILFLYPRNTPH